MFFCHACKVKNDWPGLIPISRGVCEECKKYGNCYSVPSKDLPVQSPNFKAAEPVDPIWKLPGRVVRREGYMTIVHTGALYLQLPSGDTYRNGEEVVVEIKIKKKDSK